MKGKKEAHEKVMEIIRKCEVEDDLPNAYEKIRQYTKQYKENNAQQHISYTNKYKKLCQKEYL